MSDDYSWNVPENSVSLQTKVEILWHLSFGNSAVRHTLFFPPPLSLSLSVFSPKCHDDLWSARARGPLLSLVRVRCILLQNLDE